MRSTPELTGIQASDNIVCKDDLVFEAIGATYAHRQTFASWGWFWDAGPKRWLNAWAKQMYHPSVRAVVDYVDGVTVRAWQYGSKEATEIEVNE